jgi:hypothetical protein
MRFIVNEGRKIIFGWSPKCGCTHVKNMIYYLENKHLERIHYGIHDTHELPYNISDYIFIIIIRNPFKRLISGFLEKYKLGGQFRHLWHNEMPTLTFSNFLEEKNKDNCKVIDYHHFSKQTDDWFVDDILSHKNTIMYDIEHIDYEYIGSLYNKIIPREVIEFRGNHINKNTELFNDYVYDLELDTYSDKKIPIEYFYNDALKDKMKKIYKKDFEFFESKGFFYSCKQTDDLIRDHSKSISKINTYNSSKYRNRKNIC